jgi:hypothetical protein
VDGISQRDVRNWNCFKTLKMIQIRFSNYFFSRIYMLFASYRAISVLLLLATIGFVVRNTKNTPGTVSPRPLVPLPTSNPNAHGVVVFSTTAGTTTTTTTMTPTTVTTTTTTTPAPPVVNPVPDTSPVPTPSAA